MKRFLMNLLHAIANTADNLASKLATNEPQPLLDYEKRGYKPAGIIHYGSFTFHDYYAEATPNGSYHVWHHDEYLGEYHGQRIEIVEHLHAKDQERP